MRLNYEGEKTEKRSYLKRLVVNLERGKPHLIEGDVLLLSHAGDKFHPILRPPVRSLDTINVSRGACALKEGSLSWTHGLNAPFGPAREKIKASKTMTY